MSDGTAFETFIAHQDGCVVVIVRGQVDIGAAPAFDAMIADALAASPHVVFDMADVTFLDSTGLRSIILARNAVHDGGSVTIRNAPEMIQRVFALTGVDALVAFESQPDA